jgi:3-dehydroquinate synthase
MPNIILIGFSYTGKSSVARMVARRLGWHAVDTDDMVVAKAGRPIADIFATDGEWLFRLLEKAAVSEACARSNLVIATGGGAPADRNNRRVMRNSGVVICLDARPETIYARLRESETRNPSRNPRPLLADPDPLAAIQRLKATRQEFYGEAHATVSTDGKALQQVADEVVRAYQSLTQRPQAAPSDAKPAPDFTVTTETQWYPGYVGWGILGTLGRRMRDLGLKGRPFVIADRTVYGLYGGRLEASLQEAGFNPVVHQLEPGENSKDMASAMSIYFWLAENRAERSDCIVSFGGGVAGDLAGFIAATYVRGMPLVHAPTSLLAMVDAAVGGKVAVNLPVGKNLVGAFYQPRLVLADTETLTTLPRRELAAGWAEVIKHALILDARLFSYMDENRDKLVEFDPVLSTEVIKRSAAIKAEVVSQDEKETLGLRILLNYGHTVGHALEAATGYEALLHGEAVSIGMMAAGRISVATGRLPAEALAEQQRMLAAFGLPLTAPQVDLEAVRRAMSLDKKVSGKAIRWVLLEDIGRSTTDAAVPTDVVEQALARVVAG